MFSSRLTISFLNDDERTKIGEDNQPVREMEKEEERHLLPSIEQSLCPSSARSRVFVHLHCEWLLKQVKWLCVCNLISKERRRVRSLQCVVVVVPIKRKRKRKKVNDEEIAVSLYCWVERFGRNWSRNCERNVVSDLFARMKAQEEKNRFRFGSSRKSFFSIFSFFSPEFQLMRSESNHTSRQLLRLVQCTQDTHSSINRERDTTHGEESFQQRQTIA